MQEGFGTTRLFCPKCGGSEGYVSRGAKPKNEKRLYFKLNLENCEEEWTETICTDLWHVHDYLQFMELNFKDPTAKVIISGVYMTENEYGEFIKKYLKP